MILETEQSLAKDRLEQDERLACVLRPVLATRKVKKIEDWKRDNIFQARVMCNNQLSSLVIDGESFINGVFVEACKKLRLKMNPQPSPYKVAWANNTNLQIREKCLVTYSLREFTDKVLCDILSLKVCHILLVKPWLYDKKV